MQKKEDTERKGGSGTFLEGNAVLTVTQNTD